MKDDYRLTLRVSPELGKEFEKLIEKMRKATPFATISKNKVGEMIIKKGLPLLIEEHGNEN